MKAFKGRPKSVAVPRERRETERREIIALLNGASLSAREISERLGIAEEDVLAHLEHVRMALHGALLVEPACCLQCGFRFEKRQRLKGPGRCPVCRNEHIAEPLFRTR